MILDAAVLPAAMCKQAALYGFADLIGATTADGFDPGWNLRARSAGHGKDENNHCPLPQRRPACATRAVAVARRARQDLKEAAGHRLHS